MGFVGNNKDKILAETFSTNDTEIHLTKWEYIHLL